jgi:hypothetical protein
MMMDTGATQLATPQLAIDPMLRWDHVPITLSRADQIAPWPAERRAEPMAGHRCVEVLRQFSAATGNVTSGRAVCQTCHWEGPLRDGPRAVMLDADASRHARSANGSRSPDLYCR